MTNEPKAAECECRKALKSIREELGAAVLWNDETAKIDEVLAAPCECQNIYRWSCGHLRLGSEPAGPCPTCECERLRAQLTKVVGLLQARLQPSGSPPPGDVVMLANWITRTAVAERDQLRDELAEANATLEEHEKECWCFNTNHGKIEADLRAELERTRAELAEAVDALGRILNGNTLYSQRWAAAILAKHKKKPNSGGVERAKFTPPVAWEDE